MPKGRNFVPATEKDGNWFGHRGYPGDIELSVLPRDICTSTGAMLTAPFNSNVNVYPPNPPKPFQERTTNFKTANSFSAHDNRHSFQDHGVYFGNGQKTRFLGKRLTAPDFHEPPKEKLLTAPVYRQHQTEKSFIKHFGRQVVDFDYNTNYALNYTGRPCKQPPPTRRFPKVHPEGKPGLAQTTSSPECLTQPPVPYKTPLHILAVSQEPFLQHNKWKYSYHGLSKCYPPYERVDPDKAFSIWTVKGHCKCLGEVEEHQASESLAI